VTLSVFRARKNRKTFSDLEARGILSPTDVPGIYRVSQITDLPLQIVITDELQGDEYTAYRAFSDRAKQDDIMQLMYLFSRPILRPAQWQYHCVGKDRHQKKRCHDAPLLR